ncbi:hypothetical protein Q5691_25900 [Microcoleus sp. w1-18aA5]|uniref:hypothetical protein n=1 Tax=unclassified Microcoleus TaxID=2642155 RepID=UPI002FD742BB
MIPLFFRAIALNKYRTLRITTIRLETKRASDQIVILKYWVLRSLVHYSIQWQTAPQDPEHTGINRAGFPLHAHCSATVDNF